ncbi:MAG: hypothetical protein Q9222_006929 [Ikaeria aurantiellina]
MLQELNAVRESALAQTTVIATKSLEFMAYKGYTIQDFAVWNWILSARAAQESTSRLRFVTETSDTGLGPIPMFVFQQLLRRADINATTLSSLITLARHMLELNGHIMGLDTLVLLVIRLLRQSRRVWPAACVIIAQLWAKHAKINKLGGRVEGKDATEQALARLSFAYNRILSILSLPPNMFPYQSLQHRQRAQFTLIRQMNTFHPPLILTREGFRAVTRTQLAHRKTANERKWASLKAESWPPWKEDKLGVDALIDVNHGQSRASESLVQMVEAGYGTSDWEKSAGILAGWDTDSSPTIQTRSSLVPKLTSPRPCKGKGKDLALRSRWQSLKSDVVWIARIRATRTLQEAWTCFLAYEGEYQRCNARIYHVMFEKVIHERKRIQNMDSAHKNVTGGRAGYQDSMAGDGREVVESSSSHNQATSTREPLPTFETLFDRMIHENIRPRGRLLAFLLNHAQSYSEGIKIIQASKLSDSAKQILISNRAASRSEIQQILASVPDWLFAAAVGFLCRSAFAQETPFAPSQSWPEDSSTVLYKTTFKMGQRWARARLWRHALKLVIIRKPFYHPPWNSLLMLLGQPRVVLTLNQVPSDRQDNPATYSFRKACWLVEQMDMMSLGLDFPGFVHLCTVVRNTALVVRHMETRTDEQANGPTQIDLDHLSSFLEHRFAKLVRPAEDTRLNHGTPTRKLLQVPHPAHLHVYIRTLGQLGHYDAISRLAGWISEFYDHIIDEAKETANGMGVFRMCLVAIRVFVEQPLAWYESKEEITEDEKEPYEKAVRLVDGIREVIERNDGWGGWPTDEEVDQYISRGE